MHERIRDYLLGWWGAFVCRRAAAVVAVALALAALCVWLTASRLTFLPDRSDLINPKLAWNAAYHRYKTVYPNWDDVIVLVDAGRGSEATAEAFVRALADRLETDPTVQQVLAGYTLEPQHIRTLLGQPEVVFESQFADLVQSLDVVESASLADLLDRRLSGLAESVAGITPQASEPILNAATAPAASSPAASERATARGLLDFAGLLERADTIANTAERAAPAEATDPADPVDGATRPPVLPPRLLAGPLPGDWMPLRSEGGGLFVIMAALDDSKPGLDPTAAGLAAIRRHIQEVRASAAAFAEIEAGVTGVTAIESDETTQSIADSTLASIVALVLIAALMVIVFRGVVVPLFAVATLLIGVAWSFGLLTLTIGHLQILSVVFTVILLGLGIDFAVHLLARLELVRDEHEELGHAVARVYRRVGPGMITGAVTTAAAFAIMALSDFRGVAEMGVISGGGILLCLVAMLSVFPALLSLLPDWRRAIRFRPGGEEAHFMHDHLNWVDRRPIATLVAVVVITGLLGGTALLTVRYDQNLLNLHPPGVESVEWEQRLLEEGARSVWAGLNIADSIEDARTRTLAFTRLEAVSSVDGVGLLFHPDRAERLARARAAWSAATLPPDAGEGAADGAPASEDAPGVGRVITRLRQLQAGLRLAGFEGPDSPASVEVQPFTGPDHEVRAAAAVLAEATSRLLATLTTTTGAATAAHWERVEEAFTRDRTDLLALWSAFAETTEPALADLPRPVQLLNIGTDGSLLLRVNPAADAQSILDPGRLGPFVEAMRTVDETIIGPPVQIYESSRLIVSAYIRASWLAVIVIAGLLLLDFRSIADTLCAMIPVAIGFVGMFGVMGAADVPINFANIIVMPLIFGIGVDAGVHIVHRYRLEPDGIPKGLSGGTGRGITLTMITTIIGFGCLMIAHHRGIRGLGFTMTAGLIVTFAACYTALPAALALRRRLAGRPDPVCDATDDV